MQVCIDKNKGGTAVKNSKIIISVVVLIIAVGAGSMYYFLNIKDYETEDTKVSEIVEGNFDIKLPENDSNGGSGQPAIDDKTQVSATTPTDISSDTTISKETEVRKTTNKEQKETVPVKVTLASIIEKYQPSFRDLENQASGKLDSLLSHALSEYNSQKAKSEDISYFYYFTKYNAAAKKLEASTDASFNYIFDALVMELNHSGYSSSEAQKIKDHYTSMKKERRSILLAKAKSYINI
ncbi:MAG: hypothetical protein K0Q87_2479 [Neobacillus sp.]|nr:hypothetical protein [Neobacillus sp.]